MNGDGVADVLIAAPGFDRAGEAFLFSGRTGGRLYRFDPADDMVWGGPQGLAAMGDVDGDGLADVAISNTQRFAGDTPTGPGRVRVFGGAELYLLPTPREPASNEELLLVAREGDSSQLTLTAIISFDGVPTFQVLGGLGRFDDQGKRRLDGIVPPALAGHEMEVMAFAQRSGGGIRRSAVESVRFQ